MGVMIVVQALPSGDPGQHARVPRGVIEVLLAPPMSDRVDERRHDPNVQPGGDARGKETERNAQENTERDDAERKSDDAVGEDRALEAIRRQVRGVPLEDAAVPARDDVVVRIAELNTPIPEQAWTVRVALGIGAS